MSAEDLGQRMKGYESITRAVLPRRAYTIVRVDGRAFHGFLRDADRPFDDAVMTAMDITAMALCKEASGAVFAYIQSDEISILLTDFETPATQAWFGGVIQKVVSIAASVASVEFNRAYASRRDEPATFDARAFTIPGPVEVANYFLWRQRDCVRNSVAMAAQAHFPHKRLHKMNIAQMRELLRREKGIDWAALPAGCRRGRVAVRKSGEREVTYTHRRTGQDITTVAVRSWWEIEAAPVFTAMEDGWLARTVPAIPGPKDQKSSERIG
jgi:tRNA(His) 5'-end guanylyltransferase